MVPRKKSVVDVENSSCSYRPWPRLMWVPVAAEYIGARPFFVEELIRSGEVIAVPVGNRKNIPIEELNRWVDRQIEKAKLHAVDAAA
jgi:hypothetical protein